MSCSVRLQSHGAIENRAISRIRVWIVSSCRRQLQRSFGPGVLPVAGVLIPKPEVPMRAKLKLNVDELIVDPFTTEYRKEKSGTVHGHATYDYSCTPCTYQNDATCYNYGTCNPRLYCPDIP